MKNSLKLNSWHAILSRQLLRGEKYFLFTSKLANRHVQKALFTCVV